MMSGPAHLLARAARTWNPGRIPWAHLFWAEGPRFRALGLTDGATVTTWPSETSAVSMSTFFGMPVYRAGGMGGRSSIQAVGTETMVASITSIQQPWTVVAVANVTSGADAIGGSQSNGTESRGLLRASFGSGSLDSLLAWESPPVGPHLWVATASPDGAEVRVDDTIVAAGASGLNDLRRAVVLGRSSSQVISGMTGHLAYFGLLARALTESERARLLAWSQSYYATPGRDWA